MPQTYTKHSNKASTKFRKESEKESLDTFSFPEPNYTQSPNVAYDEIMATLTGPEWKVLSKIIRETFGWHRDWKNITLTDFEKSCGMARNSVLSGVEGLLKKNLIKKKQKGPGNHLESYYQIVVGDKKSVSKKVPGFKICTPQGFKICTPPPRALKKEERKLLRNNTKKNTPPSSAIIFHVKIGETGITEGEFNQLSDKIGEQNLMETIRSMQEWLSKDPERKFKQKDFIKKILKWHERFKRPPKIQKAKDSLEENRKIAQEVKRKNLEIVEKIRKNPYWASRIEINYDYILVTYKGKKDYLLSDPGLGQSLEKLLAQKKE